jgi:hypothetical protein
LQELIVANFQTLALKVITSADKWREPKIRFGCSHPYGLLQFLGTYFFEDCKKYSVLWATIGFLSNYCKGRVGTLLACCKEVVMGIQSSCMVTIWCKCEALGGMGIE